MRRQWCGLSYFEFVCRSLFAWLSSWLNARRWLAVLLLLCCLLLSWPQKSYASSIAISPIAISPMVIASLHTYQEQPGQTTFRSRQSLRDRTDRSWQVIVFKRYQADTLQGLYLRLVGFPDLVTLAPQTPLQIVTGSSVQWTANPELDAQTPELPDNTGQYNIAQILSDLQGDIPLQIEIPLRGGSLAELVVPPFAVHEWRELAASQP